MPFFNLYDDIQISAGLSDCRQHQLAAPTVQKDDQGIAVLAEIERGRSLAQARGDAPVDLTQGVPLAVRDSGASAPSWVI